VNNEDKLYDLLEKVYLELQDTKKELKGDISSVRTKLNDFREETNDRFNNVENEVRNVKNDLNNFREETNDRFNNVENEVRNVKNDLNGFRQETNDRFDKLEEKLDLMEANNADRHIAIDSDLKKVKADLSRIEIATADNWSDIARLKAVKIIEVK